MKDRALELAREHETAPRKLNFLREYLQHVIMRELFEENFLEELVFHGGTGLRLLYRIDRFSEDLDFHTQQPNPDYTLGPAIDTLQSHLELQGYEVSVRSKREGPVKNGFIKIAGLLHEIGLSEHPEEKLSIKLEVDTNPPDGYQVETSPVEEFFPYVVHHHDLATFLAGKIIALLSRPYLKGRDVFDMNYFLTHRQEIKPNIPYLQAGLKQTGYESPLPNQKDWPNHILEHLKEANWSQNQQDLEPFLLRPADLKAFQKEFIIEKLSARTKR